MTDSAEGWPGVGRAGEAPVERPITVRGAGDEKGSYYRTRYRLHVLFLKHCDVVECKFICTSLDSSSEFLSHESLEFLQ